MTDPAVDDSSDASGSSSPSETEGTDAEGVELEPLRVGLLHSLTGPAGAFGQAESDGARYVLEAAIAGDVLGGRPIEFFIKDDQTDPTEAVRATNELINQDRVHVIIGPTIGGNTLAMAPVAAEAMVPLLPNNGTISVTSTDNDFWPWVFRAGPNDLVSVESLLQRIEATGARRIGVFAQEDAYGNDGLAYVESRAEELGLEVVVVARAPLTATEFTPQATRIRNAEPDAVIMLVSPVAVSSGLVRALDQVGVEATLWGPPGLAQQPFIDAVGEAGEGVRTVGLFDKEDPHPDEQRLLDLLAANGVLDPHGFEVVGAYAADAVLAAAAAITTPEITGTQMRDALEQTCVDSYDRGGEFCYTVDSHDGVGPDSLVPLVLIDGKFVKDNG